MILRLRCFLVPSSIKNFLVPSSIKEFLVPSSIKGRNSTPQPAPRMQSPEFEHYMLKQQKLTAGPLLKKSDPAAC
jgi:hypothetical protein